MHNGPSFSHQNPCLMEPVAPIFEYPVYPDGIFRKVLRLCPAWLAVFESPATVLGSVMLFLCLLIISNKYYYSRGDQHRLAYFQRSLIIVMTLWELAYAGCGRRNAAFLVAAVLAIAMGRSHRVSHPHPNPHPNPHPSRDPNPKHITHGPFLDSVFGMTGLANTATTFLVLWCLEKYCEIHFEAQL